MPNFKALRALPSILVALTISFKASAAAVETLPTIRIEDFAPGRFWTWDYSQEQKFFSSERYTVLSRDNEFVWIEMSTRLAGESVYRAHHRLHVSIKKCLAAYADVQKRTWSFEMYYLNDGNWDLYDPSSTLAFEEKFNCNPRVYVDRFLPYLTFFYDRENGVRLFEQKPWGKLNSSRYFFAGTRSGIASEKVFAKRDGHDYVFRLNEALSQ